MPSWLDPPTPLHGESTVVVRWSLRVAGTSFGADERRFWRLRLDHRLPENYQSFSPEIDAPDARVTSSQASLRPCSQNARSRSRSSTASRLALGAVRGGWRLPSSVDRAKEVRPGESQTFVAVAAEPAD